MEVAVGVAVGVAVNAKVGLETGIGGASVAEVVEGTIAAGVAVGADPHATSSKMLAISSIPATEIGGFIPSACPTLARRSDRDQAPGLSCTEPVPRKSGRRRHGLDVDPMAVPCRAWDAG